MKLTREAIIRGARSKPVLTLLLLLAYAQPASADTGLVEVCLDGENFNTTTNLCPHTRRAWLKPSPQDAVLSCGTLTAAQCVWGANATQLRYRVWSSIPDTMLVWSCNLDITPGPMPVGSDPCGTSPATKPVVLKSQVVVGTSYPLTLSWTPPTLNTDNTPYTNPAGYKLYWGSSPGAYPNSKTISDPNTVTDRLLLSQGTWHFVATAFNTAGTESSFSIPVVGEAGPDPQPPILDDIVIDGEASGLAWLVFTIRNQILFVEAGTVRTGASCDPQQFVRGVLPTDSQPHTLNLVAVEDVNLLPSIPNGEIALFAQCSAP